MTKPCARLTKSKAHSNIKAVAALDIMVVVFLADLEEEEYSLPGWDKNLIVIFVLTVWLFDCLKTLVCCDDERIFSCFAGISFLVWLGPTIQYRCWIPTENERNTRNKTFHFIWCQQEVSQRMNQKGGTLSEKKKNFCKKKWKKTRRTSLPKRRYIHGFDWREGQFQKFARW